MGVIADAVYAHVIPGLVVVTTFWVGPADRYLVVLFIVWQFLLGCRNILNHQIDDFDNDTLSHTKTAATIYGRGIAKRIVKLILIPLEVLIFLVLLYTLGSPFSIWIWVFLGYVIYTFSREVTFLRGKITDEVVLEGRYDFLSGIMLNEYYEKWLPFLILFFLLGADWSYGILFIVHMILFFAILVSFVKDLRYLKYLTRELARELYFGVEKYVRDYKNRLYWAGIRLYRNHIIRAVWCIKKFYYRVEYKLWKKFYKPLKDRWKGGE